MAANFLMLPDDVATCALIKILWDYHCGQYGIPPVYTRKSKPEWERTALQEKVRAIGMSFK